MTAASETPLVRLARIATLLAAVLVLCGAARAQFSMVPAPQRVAAPAPSEAEIEKEYRIDAGRHLYNVYASRIYRGRLPPLLYSVMIVETEIDTTGNVVGVSVVRKPAVDEVAPWVISMIKRAAPFPAPRHLPGGMVRYLEIWLVDRSGRFQVDSLTEGQH
jgi:hypothetical protein